MKEGYKGSMQECLGKLAEIVQSSSQGLRIYKTMFEFVGVQEEITLRRWLEGRGLPSGYYAAKIKIFLELAGFRVKELISMNKYMYEMLLLLAFEMYPPMELIKKVGMTQNKNGRDLLYDYMSGKTVPKESRQKMIHEVYVASERELNEKRDAYRSLKDIIFFEQENAVDFVATSGLETKEIAGLGGCRVNGQIVLLLASHVKSMLPLAEYAFHEMTPQEREAIREKCGIKEITRLSRLIDGLCGERAREEVIKNTRGRV